jgi:hypothetical protein
MVPWMVPRPGLEPMAYPGRAHAPGADCDNTSQTRL